MTTYVSRETFEWWVQAVRYFHSIIADGDGSIVSRDRAIEWLADRCDVMPKEYREELNGLSSIKK